MRLEAECARRRAVKLDVLLDDFLDQDTRRRGDASEINIVSKVSERGKTSQIQLPNVRLTINQNGFGRHHVIALRYIYSTRLAYFAFTRKQLQR